MIFIGIDNGVSGSIGLVNESSAFCFEMPVKRVLNYTKTKKFFNRVDIDKLRDLLIPYCGQAMHCMIERPMVNPGRWGATMSAMRAMEATLIVLELLKIPYEYIDSKEWQRQLLPKGLWKQSVGKRGVVLKADPKELKLASLEIGKRLFPSISFSGCKDADGLLIAEHCRRTRNGVEAK